MEFKKGSTYTRDDIHTLYFDEPVPKVGTGNWTTGYVRVDTELIVFMNINIPGTTGHNFPNRYDEATGTIEWYGKPNTHSQQPLFVRLRNGELTPHFFGRWDNRQPFTYLGIGKILKTVDEVSTTHVDGRETQQICCSVILQDAGNILPIPENTDKEPAFVLEKYLEEFIVSNWNNIDIGSRYDRWEEEIDGARRKQRTDTGEIDIFALSKDKTEYLVIELKKGRATDAVVGQIQRYMGYVKEEMATTSQTVKGMIIALEDDLRIRRALVMAPDVEFYRYQVSFDLVKT